MEQKVFKPLVIINGHGGCGKDTIVDILGSKYKVVKIDSVRVVKEGARAFGWNEGKEDKDRDFLARLKYLVLKYSDAIEKDILKSYQEFLVSDADVAFLSIREPEEIKKWKNIIPDTKTLYVSREGVKKELCNKDLFDVEAYDYDLYFKIEGTPEEAGKTFVKFMEANVLN